VIRFFLDRHLLVHVITFMVLSVGALVLSQSLREGYPQVTINEVVVTAFLPGASPDDVETKLVRPIEEAVREVDGVDVYHSTASDSVARVVVELYPDYDPGQVRDTERDLQKAIDAITDFPPEMESRPILFRFDPTKMPVLEIALYGSGPASSRRAAALDLERRVEAVEGVADVLKVGYADPQIEVQIDPLRARAQGVTLDEVMAALKRRNVASTGGKLETFPSQRQVVLSGEYRGVHDIERTILRFDAAAGGALRIEDVARVVASQEETGLRLHAEGEPSVHLIVRKRGNADIIDTVDRVRAVMDEVQLPSGVSYGLYNDQSRETKNRLSIVIGNGIGGAALVLLVLLAFLSPRVAGWVAFGVPFALLGVLTVIPLLGITINMVSLAGFVVVIGLVVDDAIIVAERIAYHMEQGLPGREAALRGTSEMARPVIGSSVTTILAFSPLFLLGGIPGKFSWAIPAIVIATLAVSLFECFCILPAHLVGRRDDKRPKARWLVAFEGIYERVLGVVLWRGGLVAVAFLGLLAFTAYYARTNLGVVLFPQDDSEALYVKLRTPLGTPIEKTEAVARAVERQLPAIMGDELEGVTARIGHHEHRRITRDSGAADNEAFVAAFLRNGFEDNSLTWIARVKEELVVPDDVDVIFQHKEIGPPVGMPVTVHISSDDEAARRRSTARVRAYLDAQPEIIDLEVDERPGLRQVDLRLDYERMALQHVSVESVARTVKAAFFGLPATDLRDGAETVDVRVRFGPSARGDLQLLSSMPVRSEDGRLHPLGDLLVPVEVDALAEIHHRDGVRTTTVEGNLDPNGAATSSSMAARISAELLPHVDGEEGVRVYVGGEAEESAKTVGAMPLVLGLAFLGIILVVMLLTESLLQAVFVVSAVPLGFIGVVWAFVFHGVPLSMFALLGITGLAGVVVNDSIVMVTSLNAATTGVSDLGELVRTVAAAARERLRPVLLTTLTTVAGVMPTAYGLGGRDAVLSPMSLALGWGLIFATTITLFLVPSLFIVRRRVERLFTGRA